jgi:hypothetical protein
MGATRRRVHLPREMLLQPRYLHRAHGFIKQDIEAIQAELLAELKTIDAELTRLLNRRHEVAHDLRRCRDAHGGIGHKQLRRIPLPVEVDAQPEGTVAIEGSGLRETLIDLLRYAERPLRLSELYRALLAHGWHVEGRPSHTMSNALRTAVRRGDARRVTRGVYESAG